MGLVRSFQISAVFPHLTVLENVRVALQGKRGASFDFWRSGRVLDELNARARELIDAVGLCRSRAQLPWTCRTGRKRALEIATTLALDPEMMLLDEPTAGMTHADVERISRPSSSASPPTARCSWWSTNQSRRVGPGRIAVTVLSRGARCWRRASYACDCRRTPPVDRGLHRGEARPWLAASAKCCTSAARRRRHPAPSVRGLQRLVRRVAHPARRSRSTCGQGELVTLLGRNGAGQDARRSSRSSASCRAAKRISVDLRAARSSCDLPSNRAIARHGVACVSRGARHLLEPERRPET